MINVAVNPNITSKAFLDHLPKETQIQDIYIGVSDSITTADQEELVEAFPEVRWHF